MKGWRSHQGELKQTGRRPQGGRGSLEEGRHGEAAANKHIKIPQALEKGGAHEGGDSSIKLVKGLEQAAALITLEVLAVV